MYFCRLLMLFHKHIFLEINSGIQSVSNIFDPAQDRHFVGPDIAPNCWASSGSKLFAKKI